MDFCVSAVSALRPARIKHKDFNAVAPRGNTAVTLRNLTGRLLFVDSAFRDDVNK